MRWVWYLLAVASKAVALAVKANTGVFDVPVFLHFARSKYDTQAVWIFKPIVDTLQEAFQAAGARVQLFHSEDTCSLQTQIVSSVQMKMTPIVISLCAHLIDYHSTCSYDATWLNLRAAGAYVIVYNSESHPPFMQDISAKAARWQAHEVWHYSKYILASMSSYPGSASSISRYMPPGCAQGLDFHGNVGSSPLRNEYKAGFLGQWTARTSSTQRAYGSLSGVVDAGGSYYDAASVRSYIEKFPVQLNIHSNLNAGPYAALESFRFAMLLSNSACVISELGHSLDMDAWRPVINFASQDQMGTVLHSLVGDHNAISRCQEESKRSFCMHFNPTKLLQESGFTSVLASIRAEAYQTWSRNVNLDAQSSGFLAGHPPIEGEVKTVQMATMSPTDIDEKSIIWDW